MTGNLPWIVTVAVCLMFIGLAGLVIWLGDRDQREPVRDVFDWSPDDETPDPVLRRPPGRD